MNRWLVIFVDLLLALIIVMVILPHRPEAAKTDDETPPGQILVEIRWCDDCQSDVDLWVRGPDGRPVGYSARESRYFNLLRDDLGNANDALGLNFENAFSRGAPAGEYVVNLHLYRKADKGPIEVIWRASMRTPGHNNIQEIGHGVQALDHQGREVTVLRFRLDERGNVISRSTVQIPLRRG